MGVFLNEHDDRDIFVHEFIAPVAAVQLPAEFLPDQSHMTIYDQGSKGTCVAHQIASEKQDQEYREIGKSLDFSRRYIYSFTRKEMGLPDNNEGLFPRTADKVLVSKGISTTDKVTEDAKTHAEYVAITISDEVVTDATKYRVADNFAFVAVEEAAIKQALINFKGIGCSLPYSPAWFNASKPSYTLGKPVGEGITGWHRIRLNGFRTVNGRLQIRFQNSWSKSWGDNGMAFFDFEDFKPFMRDLSVYVDVPSKILEKVKETPFEFKIDLKRGMSGYDVAQLQKRLAKEVSFPYPADGIFGPRTEKAVKEYQVKKKITPVSGIVGPKTRAALNGTGIIKELTAKKTLVEALIQVESSGNIYAIGDVTLADKAYGCLQIRQPVCDDVNKAFGTKYKAQDMLGNKELSIWVFTKYMEIYGKGCTDEQKARMWNGGPSGKNIPHKSAKIEALLSKYWSAVKKYL